jgi:hypothetical protein
MQITVDEREMLACERYRPKASRAGWICHVPVECSLETMLYPRHATLTCGTKHQVIYKAFSRMSYEHEW